MERRRLKAQIEAVVLNKAKEVRKYIDPDLTTNFGIAAVPDAVYDLCSKVQCECLKEKVVLVAYSMFIPYLLVVVETAQKNRNNIDLRKLEAYLGTAEQALGEAPRARRTFLARPKVPHEQQNGHEQPPEQGQWKPIEFSVRKRSLTRPRTDRDATQHRRIGGASR